MADSDVFQWVCAELEQATTLNALEARGTVRIALRQAGLEAAGVGGVQMRVVLEKVMPEELETRGIPDPAQLCARLAERLEYEHPGDARPTDTPEAVFSRLGG